MFALSSSSRKKNHYSGMSTQRYDTDLGRASAFKSRLDPVLSFGDSFLDPKDIADSVLYSLA